MKTREQIESKITTLKQAINDLTSSSLRLQKQIDNKEVNSVVRGQYEREIKENLKLRRDAEQMLNALEWVMEQ